MYLCIVGEHNNNNYYNYVNGCVYARSARFNLLVSTLFSMHVLHPYLVESWLLHSWQVILSRGGDYGHMIYQILGN